MKEKNLSFNTYFSVQMPNVWTPMFDLSNKEEVSNINAKEKPQIDFIIDKIKQYTNGDFMKGKMPRLLSKCYYHVYENMRKTKKFRVEDTCVGCLHRCPKFAIQYGNKTKEHGQYTHPDVTF